VGQLLAESVPLGEVFVTSHAFKTAAHRRYESLVFLFVGKALECVAVGQAPEVLAVRYAPVSPGLA
jgi:hypothetical protein